LEFPLKVKPSISIFIPTSILDEVPDPRQKAVKIGTIGRAAAIFRVEEIIIYPDKNGKEYEAKSRYIEKMLKYLETPQYLRKRLFKLSKQLRYVGLLPPLATPHHPLRKKFNELSNGEIREGVVVKTLKDKALVDVGVEQLLSVFLKNVKISRGDRIAVKIIRKNKNIIGMPIPKNEIDIYWGFKIMTVKEPLGFFLKKSYYDLVIATSRYGELITDIYENIASDLARVNTVALLFGSPREGLYEILERESKKLSDIADYIVNMIPGQGVRTVRTEEAIYASLSIINFLQFLCFKKKKM